MPCNKTAYTTQEFADADIKRIAEKSNRKTIPLRSYFCPLCFNWHLTSKNLKEDTKIKELYEVIEKLKQELKAEKNINSKELRQTVKKFEVVKDLRKQLKESKELNAKLNAKNKELVGEICRLKSNNP